jgi:hypothetical protein
MSATVTTTVSDERIKDLLCSAFEGGINYWVGHVDITNRPPKAEYYHESPVYGGELTLHVEESETVPGKEIVKLNRAALEKGLQIMQEKYPQHWADFIKENDDAITADVFVQCCVFGDIIYG